MKGACWLAYHSTECGNIRNRLDLKFAETNTSLLNIYSKCYYGKATNSTKKYQRTQSGRKLDLADFVDCDDHAGIDHYLNEPVIQA